MPSSAAPTSNYSRRIKFLGIGIAIFAALYTGAWFWGAAYLKAELTRGLASAQTDGRTVECANLTIKGYPFRAGVFCDKISVSDPTQKISARLGAFRSAAQVYDPARGIVELDGPLDLSLPDGKTVTANWSQLHASARYAAPLPKQIDSETRDFELTVPSLSPDSMIKAANAQLHLRTVEQDIDLAASTAAMKISPAMSQGRDIPEFSFSLDAQLKNGVTLAASGERDIVRLLRGQSGTVRAIGLAFTQGGGFTLSGPIAFDEAGLMNADLSISFSQAKKLGETIEKIAPEIASYVAPSLSLAASTAKPGEDPKLDVTIRKGSAAIGIFPLGQIPPLQ